MAKNPGLLRRLLQSIFSKSKPLPTEEGYPSEVDCPEVRELASDYIEEELPGGVTSTIRRHLAECKNCTAFVNTLRSTIGMLRNLPMSKAPDKVRREILDATSKRQG